MVWKGLKRALSDDEKSLDEQFEVIVGELTDSPDKVFVWQFPGWDETEVHELYEDTLADILSHGMQSQHVLVTGTVNIDEIQVGDLNPIQVRDSVYKYVEDE